ncbi:conserved hypothetical protein [Methylorubrum populi BJ001]|jgi:hypothetical protein|uniref:Uncharacterized protein n=1 Tax=Methylorubrum populi (strain ATCC BAA-705 / NCIMB 13946 / BJ001) TaxID=441620 RepID=B1Z961_METPB|nr:hypothetical protein [Methylorubrum populi]ACB79117.1 conserved hypothetical protein [Methylorubrum populi BJ001]OAH32200.1 hypothetical protein AX289_07060 [Methylorubrum populi]PZP71511.1 MAG: hypothetical protein DI590_07425 [Methylorubrum populi]
MTLARTTLCAALFAALAGGAAFAQDPSVPQRGQDSDPKLPAPQEQVPEKVRPESDTTGSTLSEKLEKSDGVIKPPAGVDPEIKTIAPEPTPNSTPVIKPPGNAK